MARPKKFESKAVYDRLYMTKQKTRLNFVMDKEMKDRITLAADKAGQSMAKYVIEAIETRLYKDGFEKSGPAASDLEGQEAKKEK